MSNKVHDASTRAEVERLLLIRKVDPYAEEAKTESIMRATGTSRSHVQHVARQLGVNRPQGVKKYKILSPECQHEIKTLRAEGYSLRGICAELKQRHGLDFRYEDVRTVANSHADGEDELTPMPKKPRFNWQAATALRMLQDGCIETGMCYVVDHHVAIADLKAIQARSMQL